MKTKIKIRFLISTPYARETVFKPAAFTLKNAEPEPQIPLYLFIPIQKSVVQILRKNTRDAVPKL
jgi:hypothetical protein